MKIADTLLFLYLFFIFVSSGYFFFQFCRLYRKNPFGDALVQPLKIGGADFFFYAAGFILCFKFAPQWVIIFSLFSILVILTTRGIAPLDFWGVRKTAWIKNFTWSAKTYLALFIPVTLLTALCSMVFDWFGVKEVMQPAVQAFLDAKDLKTILFFLFLACVVAPIWEEITFRGFLYPFLKSRMGNVLAVLISSLLFALLHQHAASFVPLTLLGACLALLYERTGSLTASIFLHSIFNSATCLVLLLIKYGSHPEWARQM